VGGEGSRARNALAHRGFTLIELLVTLVIVSTLAAMTLPAFKNVLVERKTSVAALEVKAFLEAARARAIARGRPVSVILERLSSRWDGTFIGGVRQSSTSVNSPGSPEVNFEAYNTCLRMVMAEELLPIEIDAPGGAAISTSGIVYKSTDDEATAAGSDLDTLSEGDRIFAIQNVDPRLSMYLVSGNEIELVISADQTHRFKIIAPTSQPMGTTPPFFFITILNEGNTANPLGTPSDITEIASMQSVFRPWVEIPFDVTPLAPLPATLSSVFRRTLATSIRLRQTPRPVASMVNELPRGSCIDLSLSGLAEDDPNVNTLPSDYRDCRREFASDWILPPGSSPPVPPPQYLRPVYLTFGPNGLLQSILCNEPDSLSLRRIEPQSDVYLFVGRNDQVIRAISSADLALAEDTKLKPNMMDPSGYWVRISPTSGAISAAPAQASHIIEDVADSRVTNPPNPPKPIAHLLEDSRSAVFGGELTAQ
ncbi:MAG: prepilin-type N-terminal cleavage/methylation domain-containing protein, partial [Pirellulaceae bacterium]|nr:prepilin-type N-terminal cleavage/methylation domain-containing protein [Pirellulaceae bacterium]